MQLFYAPDIENSFILPEEESRHAVKVLRMGQGEELWATDGRGWHFRCILRDANPRRALVEIVERMEVPRYWPSDITIAVGPTKHLDRMEWLVEKLTEEGVDRIIPLLTRWSERKELKTERLEKIAVSAAKQSLKARVPQILPMTRWADFLKTTGDDTQRFIAHCEEGMERRLLARAYRPGQPVVVAIGPEGDFAPEEIASAVEAGFVPVSLGAARLRTETAALTACIAIHTLNQAAQ